MWIVARFGEMDDGVCGAHPPIDCDRKLESWELMLENQRNSALYGYIAIYANDFDKEPKRKNKLLRECCRATLFDELGGDKI